MRRAALPAWALLIGSLAVGPAEAQNVAGQWQCTFSNRSARGLNYETWQYQYVLALYPNGGFQAQGQYTAMSAGYAVPFQAQGGWQLNGGLMLQGTAMKAGGPIPFGPSFGNIQPNAMSYSVTTERGTLVSYCQR